VADDKHIREILDRQTSGGGEIDLHAVLTRSRRRRMPRQIAAGATLTLATGGIVLGGFALANSPGSATSSSGSAAMEDTPDPASGDESTGDSSTGDPATGDTATSEPTTGASADGDGSLRAAEQLNACGERVAEVEPAASGLVVTPHFPAEATAGATQIEGTVTLTNAGDERVRGTTGARAAITLSRGGTVQWHTNGAQNSIGIGVDLEPGESMEYAATLDAVSCSSEEDLDPLEPPKNLPAADPGEYQVSAAIDISPDANEGSDTGIQPELELVTGPSQTIALR
jgi:hypothetical protein